MFAAAVEALQELVEALFILSVQYPLADGLGLGVIPLLVDLLTACKEGIAVFQGRVHVLHYLVAFGKEQRIPAAVGLYGLGIERYGLVIIGTVLLVVLVLETPVPSDVPQRHGVPGVGLNRPGPALKGLVGLFLVPQVAKVVPSVGAVRHVTGSLVQNPRRGQPEREYVIG